MPTRLRAAAESGDAGADGRSAAAQRDVLAVVFQGVGGVALFLVNAAQPEIRFGILGIELNGLAEVVQVDGLIEVAQGGVIVPQVHVARSAVEVDLGAVGVQVDGVREVGDGGLVVAQPK